MPRPARKRAPSTSSSSSSSRPSDAEAEEVDPNNDDESQLPAPPLVSTQTQASASARASTVGATQNTQASRATTPPASLHVKTITLSGFKSYNDASVTDLSPHCNIIVGANGSGKSNLFAAFEFVLGERDYSNLTHAERQELLHESSPELSTLTAFVELVFDNTDQRIPLETDEVVLRRTVGLKKDEFFLNRKHVSKADVANLMEAAGFSKSNPYYIVRQGRVNELCTMRDSARLQLLKEVAGTTVYDARRRESELLLAEAQAKRNKIDEGIAHIVSRLDELQEEKQDLEEFSRIDRERRAMTYLLSEADLSKAERDLDQLETQRTRAANAALAEGEELLQMHDKIEAKEEAMRFAQNELALVQQDYRLALDRRASLAKVRARRELDLRDAEERQSAREDKIKQAKEQLREVDEDIARAEDELARIEPQLADLDKARVNAAAEVDRLERRRKDLEAKSRYANAEARNQWLDQEMASLRASLQAKKSLVEQHNQRVNTQQSERVQADEALNECNQMLNENQDATDRCETQAAKTRSLRDQKSAERKEAWRLHDDSSKALREAQEKMKKAQRDLGDNLPAAVSAGLSAVERVAEELGLANKVYGPLISLFAVESPAYNTAVEVAAGGQLMHVVVEDDETASRLMEELLNRRAGRVTFKPLNVLQSRGAPRGNGGEDDDDDGEGDGPTTTTTAMEEQPTSEEAFPVISKLNYEAKFAPAIRAAFGSTLLCRNAHVASACAKRYKVDCVTLEGDQVGRRGALTGGFHDSRKSRLAASALIAQAKEALGTAQARADEAKQRAATLDQEVARLAGEIDKLEVTRLHLSTARAALTQERVKLQRRVRSAPVVGGVAEGTVPSAAQISEIEAEIQALETQRNFPSSELDTPLTEAEKAELESDALTVARQALVRAQDEEQTCRARWNKLKNELDVNLLRRRDELLSAVDASNAASSSSSQQTTTGADSSLVLVNSARADLETAKAEEVDAAKKVEDYNEAIATRKKELADLQSELDELKDAERQLSERVDAAEDAVDKILDARSVAVRAKEVAARKIRELGSLPSAELDKHRHLASEELTSAVVHATNALKRFGSVNKKALDQFVNFSEQRQALVQRQSEAAAAHARIRELIVHLDREKDEAILLTFKQVSRHFREVFSELVPNGVAELRLIKAQDADESRIEASSLDEFVGVSPRVSFSGSKETVPMQQLSGGQKALVALTLIFAIQRCDPAPFYLFDEIDQALDANHRSAVADLIRRQTRSKSRAAQFIVTTFRPEMVQAADKCFGIKFAHKVSTVGTIDKSQAMKFVKKIEEKMQAAAAAAAADTSVAMEAEGKAAAVEDKPAQGQDDEAAQKEEMVAEKAQEEAAPPRPKRSRR